MHLQIYMLNKNSLDKGDKGDDWGKDTRNAESETLQMSTKDHCYEKERLTLCTNGRILQSYGDIYQLYKSASQGRVLLYFMYNLQFTIASETFFMTHIHATNKIPKRLGHCTNCE